ncbi:unnamed protein product [Schistocephalus solidus]|uniref:Alpha-carbonic anhydrase domain-containing protein n=1 Tax=Schistocephalus solidus TaxID=70667 RepID=A0A183T5W5_SCHSO|nr:unnamed protein product [Schistocephalus solidus]
MPDLAGLDYVTDADPPRVTFCGNRPGPFNPFSSPTTDAEYRTSKNNFHVLMNCVEPGFELPHLDVSNCVVGLVQGQYH